MEKNKLKILIIEDSKLNREILHKILHKEYILVFAHDGVEALEKVKSEVPDIILLDIVLPGIDGFNVLLKLKDCETSHSIPVIFITGRSNPDDEVKGLKLGAVDYITKPFHEVVVKARIETQERILNQMRLIEKLSFVDALTNMPNRRQFDQNLQKEWNRAKREKQPVSTLMIDIDHFKIYNDTHGHQQGDIALKMVADIITSSLKRSADIAARWGGEEFSVLLPNTEIDGAMHIAEDIRKNVENALIPCSATDSNHKITVSIGATQVLPDSNSNITELIMLADTALYKAKETGRNRICAET